MDLFAIRLQSQVACAKRSLWKRTIAQQLVFIGQKMDEASMRARLDACLLDEQLASGDWEAWTGLNNPFPMLEEEESPES